MDVTFIVGMILYCIFPPQFSVCFPLFHYLIVSSALFLLCLFDCMSLVEEKISQAFGSFAVCYFRREVQIWLDGGAVVFGQLHVVLVQYGM